MTLGQTIGKVLYNARAGEPSLLRHEEGIEGAPDSITITSNAFENGARIPSKHVKIGGDVFPQLSWSGVPSGTQEIVIVVEDTDAPTPDHPFVHAILYAIAPETTELPEGSVVEQTKKATAETTSPCQLGLNTFGKHAWMGPDPIPAHGPHHYHFQIFALSEPLAIDGDVTRRALKHALPGKVLAIGELIGTFEKP